MKKLRTSAGFVFDLIEWESAGATKGVLKGAIKL